jgi:hypothetical protein
MKILGIVLNIVGGFLSLLIGACYALEGEYVTAAMCVTLGTGAFWIALYVFRQWFFGMFDAVYITVTKGGR